MKRILLFTIAIFSNLSAFATIDKSAWPLRKPANALEFDSVKPWSGQAEFSFLSTTGNTNTLTLGLKSAVRRNWTDWAAVVRAEYLRSSDGDNVTAQSYLFGTRGIRKFSDFDLFTDFEYQRNVFAGFNNLYKFAIGVGKEFFKTTKQTLRLEIGPAFVIEERVDKTKDNFGSVGAQALHKWAITDKVELNNRLSYLINLKDVSDSRYEFETTMTAPISALFSLKAGYLALYRNRPPIDKKAFDGKTTLSILATF